MKSELDGLFNANYAPDRVGVIRQRGPGAC
jgi:hypothetical protein